MIRGITFDKQLMKSADHAHEVNYYYGGDLGVTKGCAVTENVSGNLEVGTGYFIIYGRLVKVESTEEVAVESVASGTLYSSLVFEIDLTKVNTTTSFLQGAFKIIGDASDYPALTQEDLDNGGTLYQLEFARFENAVAGISNLTDTRTILDLTKYLEEADLKTINGSSIVGSGDMPIVSYKNAIINGNFQVNQRAKSGTVVLTDGQYGHDRWKAGASGCTYTFATVENITTITISAGSLIQVIEGLNLGTSTYVLSWNGTAQGKIGAGSYGNSGITGSVVGGTNLNIEFNTGTISKVRFNKGTVPIEWQTEAYADVLRQCQRYYVRFGGNDTYERVGFGVADMTTICSIMIKTPVKMRVKPSAVEYSTLVLDTGYGVQTISTGTLTLQPNTISTDNISVSCTTTGLTAFRPYFLETFNSTSGFIAFSAEL